MIIGDDSSPILIGTEESDSMFGGFSAEVAHILAGGGGDDVLVGGFTIAGDVLKGELGNNLLFLGSFAAIIEVGKHAETDTVYGFGEGDILRIAEATSPREISSAQVDGDVVLNIGGLGGQAADHATVTLKGVDFHDIQAGVDEFGFLQFAFHHATDIAPLG